MRWFVAMTFPLKTSSIQLDANRDWLDLTGLATNCEHIEVSLLFVRRNRAYAGYSFNLKSKGRDNEPRMRVPGGKNRVYRLMRSGNSRPDRLPSVP